MAVLRDLYKIKFLSTGENYWVAADSSVQAVQLAGSVIALEDALEVDRFSFGELSQPAEVIIPCEGDNPSEMGQSKDEFYTTNPED